MSDDGRASELRYLRLAAGIQCAGAVLPSLIFLVGVWNGYIEATRYGRFWTEEDERMLLYGVAPISFIAGLALLSRSSMAIWLCRALALTWPLVPLLDLKLLTGSLHGGEIAIMFSVPVGATFMIAVWALTWIARRRRRMSVPD